MTPPAPQLPALPSDALAAALESSTGRAAQAGGTSSELLPAPSDHSSQLCAVFSALSSCPGPGVMCLELVCCQSHMPPVCVNTLEGTD